MPASYPLSFRTILSAGKSRSQPASFTMSEPMRGFAYAQKIGTDIPVFWDVTFRFTTEEAQLFQLWFVTIINSGTDEFTMPIRTEFGQLTHTCRFLPDSLMSATEDGDLWTYSARIMARQQMFPPGLKEAGPIIIALLPDWQAAASLIDEAINEAMPS